MRRFLISTPDQVFFRWSDQEDWDGWTFMIISCWILLRIRNVSDKSCGENHNTHGTFNTYFFKIVLRDNVEKYSRARQDTGDNMIWCMHIACWLTEATGTYSECVILIALSWQHWLHEWGSMLCYMYIVCHIHYFLDEKLLGVLYT
jgi:hypothetical protein